MCGECHRLSWRGLNEQERGCGDEMKNPDLLRSFQDHAKHLNCIFDEDPNAAIELRVLCWPATNCTPPNA
jgi:hypothetical protein